MTGKITKKDALDRAKLYVALTRARYSVTFVYDYADDSFIEGVTKFQFGN